MRNMKLRLISAALATCMMASVLPASAVTAFADDANGNTTATTPAEDPMGTFLKCDSDTTVIDITEAGTYQMKGKYTAPIRIRSAGDVTINITGNVTYAQSTASCSALYGKNYAICVQNSNVTVNNDGNYTFTVKPSAVTSGTASVGALRVYAPSEKGSDGGIGHAVVNGGTYISEEDNRSKEVFYNYQGKMELNNVAVQAEVTVKNNGGTTTIKGGTYERLRNIKPGEFWQGAILNTVDGDLTLKNANVSAKYGSALLNLGGKVTIDGGTFTTEDKDYSAICAYTDKGQFGNDSDGASQNPAKIEIDGATIKNSTRGLEVKDGNITLKDVTFEKNGSDIYLEEGQKLDDVIDITNYSGDSFTVNEAKKSGNDEQYTMARLNVEGATVTVNGEEATKKSDTVSAIVAEKTLVTITYDEAAYEDSNLKFSGWTIEGLANAEDCKNQQTFTFEMPANNVTIKAGTATADTEDDSWDAATVITGVAIGAGAAVLTYHIGTELYAEQVLGKGVAVPKTREEVALKAWELAGKPAVELNGEPLSETVQAEKWAVESGLMQNVDGSFNGAKKMNKLKALRVLDKAQKMG